MRLSFTKSILVIFLLFLVCLVLCCERQIEKAEKEELAVDTEKSEELLDYKIVNKEDYSYLNTPRMAYRIVLEAENLPIKEHMERTAKKIWENGNKNWKEFTVFMYLPEMDTKSTAFYIAEFRPHGLIKSETQDYALYGTKWWKDDEESVKNASKKQEAGEPKTKEYFIDLSVAKSQNRLIKIKISTNFPEGTNFLVDLSRIYYEKGKSEKYAGEIYSKDIPVKDSKIELDISVNDSPWYNKYYQDAKKFSGIIDYPGIGKISPNIEVSVLFSPLREQLGKVLKILGKDGEFIKGTGVKKDMSFTSYLESKEVNIPFRK